MAKAENDSTIVPEQEGGRKLEQYNSLVQSAQILDIKLTSSSFSIKPDYFELRDAEIEARQSKMKREFNWQFQPIIYDTELGVLGGAFVWSVDVKKGRKKILIAQASYTIAYHEVPEVDREPAFAFLEKVGRFATYPYFRSFVSQMSWAAGADVPILPILREATPTVSKHPPKSG